MLRKTKRQQQISKIPRKKGRYASQNQVIAEEWIEDKIIEGQKMRLLKSWQKMKF